MGAMAVRLIEKLRAFKEDIHSEELLPAEALQVLSLAEDMWERGVGEKVESSVWHEYLNYTGRPRFLLSLGEYELRERWAETVFKAVFHSDYNLLDLFRQRAEESPERVLFEESVNSFQRQWNYADVDRYTRRIAAAFYKSRKEPRVVIFLENCADGACADLGCLFYDILTVPLNVHFDEETLTHIFNKLGINIAVTDSRDRLRRLMKVSSRVETPFQIFVTDKDNDELRDEDYYLGEACSLLSAADIESLLSSRRRKPVDEVASALFTSGSTGKPKGVCFSQFNMVTKRFARAAALPGVGRDETLLCYLPLYHTFGRFLEMLGMIYWGGTYVFSGNPSFEALLRCLPEARPTGLIGIPLRWIQLRDECIEKGGQTASLELQKKIFDELTGGRLRWGLSAAGYLDPGVFHFFHRNGTALCSGFGMTEATGGLTMTPPGEYQDNSVGKALPGAYLRSTEKGELLISGPYIARYLDTFDDHQEPSWRIPPFDDDYWLPTGDLFRKREDGHYEIVDRIKDIYKNNRGQTVAPRRVEQKFVDVPGIKQTFLVGDGRDYNVLLITPDPEEPLMKTESMQREEDRLSYYQRIASAANQELAPYERVVNIAVLDRDFDAEHGELTPKGSFKRKVIEKNFKEVIERLYEKAFVELKKGRLTVRIPRWFFRDLGILESDIIFQDNALYDKNRELTLKLEKMKNGNILIGDLEYRIKEDIVDMGLFSRKPGLWTGNPSLILFSPCKEGWYVPFGPVSEQIFLPFRAKMETSVPVEFPLSQIRDQRLVKINDLSVKALFGSPDNSRAAVQEMESLLKEADDRTGRLITSRLGALSHHPSEEIRSLAYRIILVEDPTPDYGKVFPEFVYSGLSFLNEESIQILAEKNIEKRRLDALRKRLHSYRTQLQWPADPTVRKQFKHIFVLLTQFVQNNISYYSSVRAELAAWALHQEDKELAETAHQTLMGLGEWFDARIERKISGYSAAEWMKRIVFDESISGYEVEKLKKLVAGTTFLHKSLMLAFNEEIFDLNDVKEGGIWITRLQSGREINKYLASIRTESGRHFNLLISMQEKGIKEMIMEDNYWFLAVAGYPHGDSPLPRLGSFRPEMGAMSLAYIKGLTVWERLREYDGIRSTPAATQRKRFLQKLFTRAISAYYSGLKSSEFKIIPGSVDPMNTVVPEPDFRIGSRILSVLGWTEYRNTLDLVKPLVKNFYRKTAAFYPWTEALLESSWIFDAAMESLGSDAAPAFFSKLQEDLKRENIAMNDGELSARLDDYLEKIKTMYFAPLALTSAIDRFKMWEKANPEATHEARANLVDELYRLYRIDRHPATARFALFRHTYFDHAGSNVTQAFSRLLRKMHHSPDTPPTVMTELSDLQALLTNQKDRDVFSKMIFPRTARIRHAEALAVGEAETRHVIVRTQITDKEGREYYVYEPTRASEIGRLYRMFLEQHYPKTISQQDRFFVAVDSLERIIGGISYKILDDEVSAHLDGVVVENTLSSRGIGSALLEDFCARMHNQGIKIVKTFYFIPEFYLKRNFKLDKRWGGLVRFLEDEDEDSSGLVSLAEDAEQE